MTILGWIIYYTGVMFIPALLVYLGFVRMTRTLAFGRLPGYCSELSEASESAWALAQKASSLSYIVVALLLAVATIWFSMQMSFTKLLQYFVGAIVVAGAQFLVHIVLIVSVEAKLRKHA